MSDERDDEIEGDDGDATPEDEEKGGLGLTEEFARIEAEIEREVHGSGAAGDESEEDGEGESDEDAAEPAEPRLVRFDDTDSSEWVAPVPERAGRETDEWAVDAEADDAEGEDVEAPAAGTPAADADDAEGVQGDDDAGAEEAPQADAEDEDPDAPETEAEDEQPPPATEAPEATEHTIIRPRPLAPRPPAAVAMGAGGAGLIDDADLNVKTPALWWRFMCGSILIVVSVATSISMYLLLRATEVAEGLQPITGIGEVLDEIDPGEPQTILIVGSDKRSGTPGDPGRSDTTMLLRVDADKGVLSLFSLPRDLKVEIPNYGTAKLNEAFTVGGIKKTLKTVKGLINQDIDIVVNVDFQGFADAVDAIECVYVDVDRDYFNDNAGLSGDLAYAAIDVNAGYQRLCGQNALDYVRYRHEDNDIIRAARQQDFLREARQKIPPTELLFNGTGNDLIDIFTEYTSTNIDEASELIGILKSFIAVRDVPIQQVSFEGTLEDVDETGVAYVTATDEQIQTAVDEFLNGDTTKGPRGGDEADEEDAETASPKKDEKKKAKKAKEPAPADGANVISTEDATAAVGGIDKFQAFGRTSARRLKFPVYVPTAVVPGSTYSSGSRQYEIKDIDDNKQDAYKMVISYVSSETAIVEYYGVQGTTWEDPPILKKPSESREIDGRTFDLFYDGDRLRLVAWREDGNSYWVSNTLAQSIDEDEMLAIAASVDEAHAG